MTGLVLLVFSSDNWTSLLLAVSSLIVDLKMSQNFCHWQMLPSNVGNCSFGRLTFNLIASAWFRAGPMKSRLCPPNHVFSLGLLTLVLPSLAIPYLITALLFYQSPPVKSAHNLDIAPHFLLQLSGALSPS